MNLIVNLNKNFPKDNGQFFNKLDLKDKFYLDIFYCKLIEIYKVIIRE